QHSYQLLPDVLKLAVHRTRMRRITFAKTQAAFFHELVSVNRLYNLDELYVLYIFLFDKKPAFGTRDGLYNIALHQILQNLGRKSFGRPDLFGNLLEPGALIMSRFHGDEQHRSYSIFTGF